MAVDEELSSVAQHKQNIEHLFLRREERERRGRGEGGGGSKDVLQLLLWHSLAKHSSKQPSFPVVYSSFLKV